MAEGGGEGFYSMLSQLSFPHIKKYSPGIFDWLFEVSSFFGAEGSLFLVKLDYVYMIMYSDGIREKMILFFFKCREKN